MIYYIPEKISDTENQPFQGQAYLLQTTTFLCLNDLHSLKGVSP